jgi:hypothetical protein
MNNNGAVDREVPAEEVIKNPEEPKRDRDREQKALDEQQRVYVEKMTAATDKLSEMIEKLSKAVKRNPETVAAIGSEHEPTPDQQERFIKYAERAIELKQLKKTTLENGDAIEYRFPLTHIRSLPYQLTDGPAAFTERGILKGQPHIEIMGGSDHHISMAMKHAARRWDGQDVKIHINPESKHAAKVIEHAVREGLNVVNQDPRIQALVIAERERQANPLVHDRRFADQNFALIEPAGTADRKHAL